MMISNLEDSDVERYILDVPRTLIANTVNLLWIGLMVIFMLYSISILNTLEDPSKIIGLIVVIFAMLKMSSLLTFSIQYKPREYLSYQSNDNE